jgi:outer membrane receptor protein involved in Fe transport
VSGPRFGLRLPLWSVAAALATRASPVLASPPRAMSCPTQQVDTAAVSEQWAPPLDRIVTAHGNDLSLRDALDRVAAVAKLRMSYSADLLPMSRAVCLSADKEPVGRVLAALLDGTNVGAVGLGGDQVVLAPRRDTPARPADPQMSTSLGVLDRVVVTGSATSSGVPERELSIGLNVLDGRQLSRDNTGTLSGALDDYVPGVWAWAQSPSTMVSSFASIRGASSFGLSYPKVYIDGIEVANPLLLSRFNPESIDRIEVIRGPQGSALYGTDAISGVVNIVTRHEGAPAEGGALSLRSTVGVSQNSVNTPTSVLTQNHSLSIATGTSAKSADFHVAGGSIGSYIPNGYSRDLMATAGARVVGTLSSVSGSARLFVENAGTPNTQIGSAPEQVVGDTTNPQSVTEYTVGVTGTTLVDRNWTMSLVAGIDGYRLKNVQATSFTPVQSLLDSALHAAQGGADRATLRASSVYEVAPSAPTHATFTFSLEHATLRVASLAPPVQMTEAETEAEHGGNNGGSGTNSGKGNGNGSTGASGGNGSSSGPGGPGVIGQPSPSSTTTQRVVSWQNSTGLVAQSNVALMNTLFLTGGVRFEHDSRLAGVDQIETLPMLGASVVQEHGPVSVKLRTAYGEGIRPPTTPSRLQFWETHDVRILTQNALGPERQAGIESGIDLFFRHALALQTTYFNQRASGLIELVGMPADTNRHSRHLIPVAENVGEISNHGWELQATGNYRALSLNGTMSFVDSRVQKVAAGYTGDLVTGDRMLQVPARTQSLGATWNATRWRATIGASRALDWIYYDQARLAQAAVDTPAIDLTGRPLRQFWKHYNGGTRLRAAASRDFRDMFTFEVSGENLLNHQTGEPDDATIIPGRTLMTGVRVKF